MDGWMSWMLLSMLSYYYALLVSRGYEVMDVGPHFYIHDISPNRSTVSKWIHHSWMCLQPELHDTQNEIRISLEKSILTKPIGIPFDHPKCRHFGT
jgi:hypothetical protein